jgi:hypothetical protein
MGYHNLSTQERGERFRNAIEYLRPIGAYAGNLDSMIALEGVGLYDNPTFPGVSVVIHEGTPGVRAESLHEIVLRVAQARAYHTGQNFIGPVQRLGGNLNFLNEV